MKEGDGVPRRPYRPRSSTSDTIPYADADSPVSTNHKSASLSRPQSCRLPLPPPPPPPPILTVSSNFTIDTEDTTSLNNILDALEDLDDASDSESSSDSEKDDDILSPLPVFNNSTLKKTIPVVNGVYQSTPAVVSCINNNNISTNKIHRKSPVLGNKINNYATGNHVEARLVLNSPSGHLCIKD
ncbi:uncharacterized protein LOC142325706 [Lycorma delicatula]|uniref:uncharacterized protein LOC142325706 n=1 Tax=Lycorma delicatula TaxID=130591 RepID=UPI003F516F2E